MEQNFKSIALHICGVAIPSCVQAAEGTQGRLGSGSLLLEVQSPSEELDVNSGDVLRKVHMVGLHSSLPLIPI